MKSQSAIADGAPFRVLVLGTCLLMILTTLAPPAAQAAPRTDLVTDAGLLGVTITNLGYIGHAFTYRSLPSGEYPRNSKTEHIYRGGLWVGARAPDGSIHVSTGAQDANGLVAGDEIREFVDDPDVEVKVWSNSQNADNYNPEALANQHIEVGFNDYAIIESGNHTPLGLSVNMRTLSWGNPYADDYIILDYRIVNISGNELRDVYLAFWIDTTVGNTDLRDPYDGQAAVRWNYYDDKNGAWGAQGHVDPDFTVGDDPDIWMAYEYDADGDEGLATSWIGYRLLGTNVDPQPEDGAPPVSYNAWGFRGVPERDDWYYADEDSTELLQGKYQLMANQAFTAGVTQEVDYSAEGNWVSLMSTGPFPSWAPNDTLQMSWAIVAGQDSLSLLSNSKVAQKAYDDGFSVPGGPPSPRLNFSNRNNSIVITWAPGDSLDADGEPLPSDSPLRSPEQHISEITAKNDFQGYRVYRYQGEKFTEEPLEASTLVAEFDIIDGQGFDTGLPPLNDDGLREFVDTNLLDGFPYRYSIISFSAPDLQEGLPEYPSGYGENDQLVYPGPAPAGEDNPVGIGVYPNPYRAGSMFDDRAQQTPELGRKLWFTGLPTSCKIQVFTLVGEVVKTLNHDDPTTGQKSWNLLSDYNRAIAPGLYIFAVTNNETGEVQRGKLVIIK